MEANDKIKFDHQFFSHDIGARNDPKLIELQTELGHEGKGIFWDLIEVLYEQNGYLQLDKVKAISYGLHTNEELLRRIITGFELFEHDDTKFWSESVLRRINIRLEKSEKARAAALTKHGRKANAVQTQSERSAIKERTEQEKQNKKEKEIEIEKPVPTTTMVSCFEEPDFCADAMYVDSAKEVADQFERCYHQWGGDGSKDEAIHAWSKLNTLERQEIESKIESFVRHSRRGSMPQFYVWIDANSSNNYTDWKVPNEPDQFSVCFNAYGMYGSEAKSREIWKTLSRDERAAIEKRIPIYLESTPGGDFRCNFENWIDKESKSNWKTPIRVKQKKMHKGQYIDPTSGRMRMILQ